MSIDKRDSIERALRLLLALVAASLAVYGVISAREPLRQANDHTVQSMDVGQIVAGTRPSVDRCTSPTGPSSSI